PVFLASTFAFGTTAPAGSETVPVMEPRSDCANAKGVRKSTPRAHSNLFIDPPILVSPLVPEGNERYPQLIRLKRVRVYTTAFPESIAVLLIILIKYFDNSRTPGARRLRSIAC